MKARTDPTVRGQPSPEATSMRVAVGAGASRRDVRLTQRWERDPDMNHQGLRILAKIIARSILKKRANPQSK